MFSPTVGAAATSPDTFRRPQSGVSHESIDIVAARTSVSADLTVVTAEGDRVTLSADAERRLMHGEFRSDSSDGDSFTSNEVSVHTASIEKSFGISVEGELSREEIRDLRRLFSKARGVIKKAVSGDEAGAFRKAGKLQERFGRLDSLAAFELNVDVERERASLSATRSVATIGAPLLSEPRAVDVRSPAPVIRADPVSVDTTARRTDQPISNVSGERPHAANDPVAQRMPSRADGGAAPATLTPSRADDGAAPATPTPSRTEVDAAPGSPDQTAGLFDRSGSGDVGATIRELVSITRETASGRISVRTPDLVEQAVASVDVERERASLDVTRTVATPSTPVPSEPRSFGLENPATETKIPEVPVRTAAKPSLPPIFADAVERSDEGGATSLQGTPAPAAADGTPATSDESPSIFEALGSGEIGALLRELVSVIQDTASSRVRQIAPDVVDEAAAVVEAESQTEAGVQTIQSLRVEVREFFSIQASVSRSDTNPNFGFSLMA